MVVPSPRGNVGGLRKAQIVVVLATLLVGAAIVVAVHELSTSPPSCLDRGSPTVLRGTFSEKKSIPDPPDEHTVDARTGVSLTSGVRALEIGERRAPRDLCVMGWTTVGQQSRSLTWRSMHDDIEGSALRVYGTDYVVDGLRADNVEDGFDPRGGDGFELRNAFMTYIRDDCVENDERRAGTVVDSLFDGCYTFFSEQDSGDVTGESLIFDNVLVRLESMPGPYGTEDPNILGHGSFFKNFEDGGRHEPIIRDSRLLPQRRLLQRLQRLASRDLGHRRHHRVDRRRRLPDERPARHDPDDRPVGLGHGGGAMEVAPRLLHGRPALHQAQQPRSNRVMTRRPVP